MSQKLKDKVAVLTGAGTGGIGTAVAKLMAEEGAKVVINDIGKDDKGKSLADSVVEEIKQAGGTAVANYDSVTTMQGGKNIIETAISNFGRIDILVNTAGNFFFKKTVDITEEEFDSLLAVHIKGTFACCKAAIPYMIDQKFGRIINVTSRGAFYGTGNLGYAVGKAGIIGASFMLAAELKDFGITVNILSPKAKTKLFPGPPPGAVPMQVGDNLPDPENAVPEYLAPAVAYLCTDEAKDITGKIIGAGGGDVIVYAKPMQFPGQHQLIRKEGKWTIDELSKVMPQILGLA